MFSLEPRYEDVPEEDEAAPAVAGDDAQPGVTKRITRGDAKKDKWGLPALGRAQEISN